MGKIDVGVGVIGMEVRPVVVYEIVQGQFVIVRVVGFVVLASVLPKTWDPRKIMGQRGQEHLQP